MATSKLKKYFPMIREREEILREIKNNAGLLTVYSQWKETQQEEFLDICSGAKGVKMLYDSFFKEVMNPESTPDRLSDFLSLILRKKVWVLKVLPNDSVRIAAESALLITDIVVEFEDGSIANVEVQKIGYYFPGERAACYSADLLLRQYKRLRDERKKEFRYGDIQPVYTIVLFESSPGEFKKFPNEYVHYIQATSDTGLKLNLLQQYFFIPLDIFEKCIQNRNVKIQNELDAWLLFFSSDKVEDIITIIEQYPKFLPMYRDLYELCRNTEAVMGLFSKELQIMDDNTVRYMIDDMQEQIDRQQAEIHEKEAEISRQGEALHQKDEEISKQGAEINRLLQQVEKMQMQLQTK
jgi:hypothetical protein